MLKGRRLGEILVALGGVTPEQVDAALDRSRKQRCTLGQALVDLRSTGEVDVLRALGVQVGVPLVHLGRASIDLDVLELIPESMALAHRILPLEIVPGPRQRRRMREAHLDGAKECAGPHGRDTLIAAVESPRNAGIAEVEFHTGLRVTAVLAPAAELSAALIRAYRTEPTPGHGLFLGNGPGMEHVVARYFETTFDA